MKLEPWFGCAVLTLPCHIFIVMRCVRLGLGNGKESVGWIGDELRCKVWCSLALHIFTHLFYFRGGNRETRG